MRLDSYLCTARQRAVVCFQYILRLSAFIAVAFLALAWAPAFAQSGTQSDRAGDSTCGAEPIRMADQTWESASFTTQVIRLILEHGYGCTVEIVPGATAATESALVQNDLQIIAEQWSGRSPIIEKGISEGRLNVVGDTLKGGAEQGWYVPDYVVHGDPDRNIKAMAPDLKSWRDLPTYKSLFTDPEEPDKGRFLNCPSGWVCEQTNSRLLEIHGLTSDYTNFRAGTGAALDSAISSAYEQGESILFYYWQPAGLMAKYSFSKVEQDPFDQQCWDTIVSGEGDLCSSDFLLARLGVAVSTPFSKQHADLVSFFEHLQFEPDDLNGAILTMNEQRLSGETVALEFMRNKPQAWGAWLPDEVAQRVRTSLNIASDNGSDSDVAAATTTATVPGGGGIPDADDAPPHADPGSATIFPDWSMAKAVNDHVSTLVQNYGATFRDVSNALLVMVLLPVERSMQQAPPWLILLLTALLAWHATRKPVAAVVYVAGLYLIGAVGLWDKLIQTFALVLVATLLSIIIGVPIGILGARIRWLRRLLTPVMDVMQTLPSFVYLIPVLMLFGLGKVPALFATIVYAVPPLIRLTILGLRHVDPDVMEAAQSFGVTRWQMLTRVSLPLARPSIMAGINQATMMALAMVVVASMIGARGLGEDVLAGIQTLDVGRGLQAGIAIVILAIVIDRISQAYGRSTRSRRRQSRQRQATQQADTSAAPATVDTLTGTSDVVTAQADLRPDPTGPGSNGSDVDIQVRDVYKIFGPKKQLALDLLRQHVGKTEVQNRTGNNVGLAGVNLSIPAGQITCIMGLSGSGKSTLVRHLNRLIDPTAGAIILDGHNILELSLADLRVLRRQTISMVFQNFGLLPHLSVIDNVAFGLRIRGESKAAARAKAQEWLQRVGLAEYERNYPDELSGGMRQRVGLARALAVDSRIILMDEAFSALDPLIRYEMQDQLLALQDRLKKTIVFITHDIDEALRLGQHIVILRDGQIEQTGTPDQIRHAPINDYVRGFVAARPTPGVPH